MLKGFPGLRARLQEGGSGGRSQEGRVRRVGSGGCSEMLKSHVAPTSRNRCICPHTCSMRANPCVKETHLSTSPVCPANSFTAALDSTSHRPEWQSALAVSSWGGGG